MHFDISRAYNTFLDISHEESHNELRKTRFNCILSKKCTKF